MDIEPPNLADIRFAAMSFLAMREHSVKELRTKLGRKYSMWPYLLDSVIQELVEQNLQSDERFTSSFIAMRQRQGKGSRLICLELRERGIGAELIAGCLDEADNQWQQLASAVRSKRFGNEIPKDSRERAKQIRFLQTKGFASHHIQQAFNSPDLDSF